MSQPCCRHVVGKCAVCCGRTAAEVWAPGSSCLAQQLRKLSLAPVQRTYTQTCAQQTCYYANSHEAAQQACKPDSLQPGSAAVLQPA